MPQCWCTLSLHSTPRLFLSHLIRSREIRMPDRKMPSSSTRDGYTRVILHHTLKNNWSQVAAWHFEQQEGRQSYSIVHRIHNVRFTYCADKMHALPCRPYANADFLEFSCSGVIRQRGGCGEFTHALSSWAVINACACRGISTSHRIIFQS